MRAARKWPRHRAMRASVLGALVATAASALDAQPVLTATVVEPRAFGYQVGDVASGTVLVHVPAGLALDEASLPKPGARGKALELRSVERRSAAEPGGQALTLRLDYQVFLSPAQTRTLETPTLSLRFVGLPREQALRIEPWPVTVAPLAPADVSPRRGLGELQPDAAPPLIATTPARWRLLAEGSVALLLLGYLAQVYLGAPWWARSRRPFNRAWHELQALRKVRATGAAPHAAPHTAPHTAEHTAERTAEHTAQHTAQHTAEHTARAAIQRLHAALNASAGEVVFEAGIGRFIGANPRFGPMRDDLVAFLRMSSREFFAPAAAHPEAADPHADPHADPLPWLVAFCGRCRDAERGAA